MSDPNFILVGCPFNTLRIFKAPIEVKKNSAGWVRFVQYDSSVCTLYSTLYVCSKLYVRSMTIGDM